MNKMILLSCLLFGAFSAAMGQHTITGTFPPLANQQVKLFGFQGFDTYGIDTARVSPEGVFVLQYGDEDRGMGYLTADDEQPFIIILGGEETKLQGEALSHPQSIAIIEGEENQLFEQYAGEHPRREQALSAWIFLERIYQGDSLFIIHEQPRSAIEREIQRIREEDEAFLRNLNTATYVSWFLPVRRLVSAVPAIAQYRTDEIPAAIAAFRTMDYTDPRLYKSGLLRETIDSHFWLIENSGRSLDSVFIQMNISIDHMIQNLENDPKKLNEIMGYLFNLLEQRSLFGASEHLALKLLEDESYSIDSNLAGQLESYRAMKIGQIAPDIVFEGDVFRNGQSVDDTARLSDIDADYLVVVFGSAGCPLCNQELREIKGVYQKWNRLGLEVVYISLDDERADFERLSAELPFVSFSDYKNWETPSAKDYHVFGTPTMYLLSHTREILLRPNSVRHLDSWVDWFLVQGNR